MTQTTDTAPLPPLPMPREWEAPFDPPAEYAQLRAERPILRVTCPTGLAAWLVSRYADVREVLGDARRFSARPGQIAHVLRSFDPEQPVGEGDFSRMDGPEHLRIRRHFAPQVSSVKRMAELRPLVQQIVDEQVDALATMAPPVDLHTGFSQRVTTAVIAELIGVPLAERELFQRAAVAIFDVGSGSDDVARATDPLFGYLYQLITTRRAAPDGDDVLSRLIVRSSQTERPLTDLELVAMNSALLVAGFDSTATLLTHGLLALMEHPEQWERLCRDPGLAPTAGEELVRYLGVGVGLLRQATEDTELAGQRIAAGDYVVVAIQSANRDPELYPDADTFDVGRRSGPHVGFGHGAHQCVGQQIARLELTTALQTLAQRVPSLRLAAPLAEVEFRTESVVRGPATLRVGWDEILPRQDAACG
jgi:cytochrome P450